VSERKEKEQKMLIQNTTSPVSSTWAASDVGVVAIASPRGEYNPPPKPEKIDTRQPTVAQLESAVHDLNQSMKANSSTLAFSIDPDTEQTVVKLMDSSTGEVIKQFPSKEAIAIARAIGDIQQGLLLKQKA
jgi:flagellar protein FlaG